MATVTIAGTLFANDRTTPITAGCTLAVSVNGAAAALTAVTSVVDGTYLTAGLTVVAGDVLTIYIQDGVNTQKACTVTRGTGSNMTGIDLYQNTLALRSDDGSPLTGTNINTADNNAATGITAIIQSGTTNTALTLATGVANGRIDLYIPPSQTVTMPTGTTTCRGHFTNAGSITVAAWNLTMSSQSTALDTVLTTGGATIGGTSSSILNINMASNTTTLGDNLTCGGGLTITNGTLDVTASNRSITFTGTSGTFTGTGTFTARSGTVIFAGGSSNNLVAGSNSFYNITISGATQVSLFTSNLTVTHALNISVGKFALAGKNLDVTGATFTNAGTLILQGAETLTGFTNDTANSGTVQYVGTGTTSYTGLIAGNSYANLTINGSGRTWTLTAGLTVSGTLTRTVGTLVDGGFAINVAGDWTNTAGAGAYTLTGTTTLNGAGGSTQTVAGSTTFTNLTATAAAARTIVFTDGTTQTISNSITLQGASGQLLTLQGSSTGGWALAMPVTQTIDHVSVSYSTSTGNTAAAGATSTNGGNNTNWTFGVSAPVAAFSGTPLTITVGGTVVFTDSSTNTPTSWLWNFGDGSTSTSQNPSHTYTAPGTYTVTLTATNAGGSDDEVKAAYMTVKTGTGLGIGIAVMRQRRGR